MGFRSIDSVGLHSPQDLLGDLLVAGIVRMAVDEERHVEHDVVDRDGGPDFDVSDVDIVDTIRVRASSGDIVFQLGGEYIALVAELDNDVAVSKLDDRYSNSMVPGGLPVRS